MKKQVFRATFLFSLFLIAGCYAISDNDLPEKNLHDDDRLVGEFYATDDKGRRHDIRIEKLDNKRGHYAFVDNGPDATRRVFRLFNIGDREFISLPSNDEGNGPYVFGRLSVSRTQLVFEGLQEKWLIANPDALPNTEIKSDIINKVRLKATSDNLQQFIQIHADSKTLFDIDHPILFNRAGT